MRAHGSQWFSHKMNNRHPLQLKQDLKKSKLTASEEDLLIEDLLIEDLLKEDL